MGFLDTVRTQARALAVRNPDAIYKAQYGDNLPAWLRATGEAHKFDQLNTPASQARLYTQLSWIQTAISMVASTAITSRLSVKRQKNVDATEQDIDNHAFEQLLRRPNPSMSRSEFIESTISFHRFAGNAYWWKNCKDEKSPPDELWIVPPQQLRPLPDGKMFVRGYMYDPGDGNEIFLEPWEIVHFKRFNAENAFVGSSALEALALVSQGDLSAQRWNLNFFDKDNAKLPGALAFADPIDDDAWAKMRSDIEHNYGGTKRKLMMLRNAGRGGVQWINMAVSQRDMEFLAGRQFNRDEIYSALAPGLSSILDKNATEANATAGKATFIEYAVWPYLVHIAEKITNDLMPIYGDDLVCEFEDIRITDRNLKIAEQNAFAAVHTIDEVRAKFYNDKPIGDDRGKLLPVEVPVLARQPAADATALDLPTNPQAPTVGIAKPAALLTDTQKPPSAADAQQQAATSKALKAAQMKAHSGGMVALPMPEANTIDLVSMQGFLPANSTLTPKDEFHVTLCYLGEMVDMTSRTIAAIETVLFDFCNAMPPLTGRYNGIGRFQNVSDGSADALYVTFDCKNLPEFRQGLMDRLRSVGIDQASEHGFIPHITLGYVPSMAVTPLLALPSDTITIDEIWLALGDTERIYKLKGQGASVDSEDLADEVKRFKNWLRKRKNPDLERFSSDLLTAEHKARILESMTVTVKEGGADQDFFTLADNGQTTHKAALQLNKEDEEAEHKQRLKIERRNAKKLAEAFVQQLNAMIPDDSADESNAEIEKRVRQNVQASQSVRDALTRALQDSADLGVSVAVKQFENVGFGFDWTLANQQAHDWVGTYSLDLIQGIDNTSQQRTQQILQRWINSGEPLSTLKKDLTPVFGEQRAATIAATETTRAYAEANRIAFRESKVVQKIQIQTAADELVCPICGPLSNKQYPLETGVPNLGLPPFHVQCRCWITCVIEIPEARQKPEQPTAQPTASDWPKFESVDAAQQWAERNFSAWRESLDFQEEDVLGAFKGGKSGVINGYLRGNDFEGINPKLSQHLAKVIDGAFDKSGATVNQDVTVWRGMRSNLIDELRANRPLDSIQGLIVSDRGFAATSLSQDVAEKNYGVHGVVAEIRVKSGSKAIYLDLPDFHNYDYKEYEMLLPRDTKFKVLSAKQDGEMTRLVLEVIDGN